MKKRLSQTLSPFLHDRSIDYEVILDLLPSATLLVDAQQKKIVFANAKMAELTAYTRQELQNLDIQSLFLGTINFDFYNLFEENSVIRELKIQRRNSPPIEVHIKIQKIKATTKHIVVTVEEATSIRGKELEQELETQRWNALQAIALSHQQSNSHAVIKQIVASGKLLTGASTIAIYRTESNSTSLTKVYVSDSEIPLPPIITVQEASRLQTPYIWVPGKRTLADIHKIALVHKLKYLASAPIDQTSPLSGIIILADQFSPPNIHLSAQVLIIAANILAAYERFGKMLHQSGVPQTSIANTAHYLIDDHISDSIIYLTEETQIINVNLSAESMLGYTLDEIIGENIDNVLVGSKPLHKALHSAQQGNIVENLGDVRFHRRDGSTFLAHVRIVPLLVDNAVDKIAILITDLSEHEEFRTRMHQLEQQALLGEVSAIFAHEVRNPINNISTGLQLMAMNAQPDPTQKEHLERMQQDCERLDHLMKSVLNFSGRRDYKAENIDIAVILHRIFERWAPRMKRLNIAYKLEVITKNTRVIGDYRALEQVFTNLISNAINAMRESGGTIVALIQQPQNLSTESIEINIMDTGPGIPEENIERIFHPFFTTHKDGTGLGLTITKQIVSAHRGIISVDSIPGSTVFHVELPSADNTFEEKSTY